MSLHALLGQVEPGEEGSTIHLLHPLAPLASVCGNSRFRTCGRRLSKGQGMAGLSITALARSMPPQKRSALLFDAQAWADQ